MGSVRLVGFSTLLVFILYPQSHHMYKYSKHDLYIEQTGKTWDDASQSCTLVGSDRVSTYDVIVQDIPVLQLPRTRAIPTNRYVDLHWIGATATFTPWLELLGCYVYKAISTIRTYKYRYRVIGHVADCYLQCESHFGVNETHCHCLSNIEHGRLVEKPCRMIMSSYFHSDIVGTNVSTVYNGNLYQIAIYNIYNSTFHIKADTLDECLVKNTTHQSTYPCDSVDSSQRTWTDAMINGLSSNDRVQSQWTRFLRRRIIRWNRGIFLDSNTSACVSVKELSRKQEYEIVLRQCDYKLPYICQKGDAQNTHKIMTSSLPTSTFMPTEPPGNTISSNGETGSFSMIVGMVVGGAVLLLIIVAIVLIKLRRRAHSKPQPVSPTTENFVHSKLAAKYEERSSHHSPKINESGTTSSTIVKPTGREEESGEMLPTTNDDVYNHTWDNKQEQQSDHVYSTTCSGGEYEYSQAPSMNSDVYNSTWDSPITELLTDHVYSITGNENDANLYDHTESKESKFKKH